MTGERIARRGGAGLPPLLAARLRAGGWLRIAHRGAPAIAPENSRRAIEAAVTLGVDLVEVDVHRTIDGHLVLHHDRDMLLNGTATSIVIATLAQLQAADFGDGERVVTLAEAMETVRGRAGLFVDLKADGLAGAIVATAERAQFTPLLVAGVFRESLTTIRRLNPAIGTALGCLDNWREAYGPDIIERTDAAAMTIDHLLVDAAFVARCHAAGRAVIVWTVDEISRMRELARMGVDGIMSNRPDLFASLA